MYCENINDQFREWIGDGEKSNVVDVVHQETFSVMSLVT